MEYARRPFCQNGHDLTIHGRVETDGGHRCYTCKKEREQLRYLTRKGGE